MRYQFCIKSMLLYASLIYLATFSGPAAGNVVINEVEPNPSGDEDAFKPTVAAWLELYNSDGLDVDISGWSVNTTLGRSAIIPQGTVIKGLDYYVLDVAPKWLDHSGEALVLFNATGVEVDRTAVINDELNDDSAWTRDPDGWDTNSSEDWKLLASSRGF